MDLGYQRLCDRFAHVAHLRRVRDLLEWDMLVFMPTGSAGARTEAITAQDKVVHDLLTAPDLGYEIALAEAGRLDDRDRANLAEMERRWRRATAVPADLVEAQSKATATSVQTW